MQAESGAILASVDEAKHRVVVVAGAVQFTHVIRKSSCVGLSSQKAEIELPHIFAIVFISSQYGEKCG